MLLKGEMPLPFPSLSLTVDQYERGSIVSVGGERLVGGRKEGRAAREE